MGQGKSAGKKIRAGGERKSSVSQDKSRLQKAAVLEEVLMLEVTNAFRSPRVSDTKVAGVPRALFWGVSSVSPHGEQLSSYFQP